jgi:phenylalanyl-tRNA synthetase beta chain
MKVSVQWLCEWVDVGNDIASLSHALTMAGLEIEANQPAAPQMSGIVVAEVLSVEQHPDAEKLHVCRVDAGSEVVQIVCGAPNVRAGMKAPLALVGAKLPDGTEIKKAKLRGIESFGMLCSARELGLSEDSSGLLDLPRDLSAGADLVQALALDDRVLEINLTPNRGDCMSIAGIAREIAAVTDRALHPPQFKPAPAASKATFGVKLEAPEACPRLAGRVIRNVRANQPSPLWIRERLRRAGVRSINLLVDVTNYIVQELGQPMHAYDLSKLNGGIVVRMARENEKLALLDGRTIDLTSDILVIADEKSVVGMAGVMGGEASGISDATTDIFLEAAHFTPNAIAGRSRRFGLVTDASQRFERGVDPELPVVAIERATEFILQYAGGEPGPTVVSDAGEKVSLVPIRLRRERIDRVLGVKIDSTEISRYLTRLGMKGQADDGAWRVTPPSWRFDVRIEEDLIEEIARLYGYDKIPATPASIVQFLGESTESTVRIERVADLLSDRGYYETITYSFVDPVRQRMLFGDVPARSLVNPMSADLGVMRVSLWPGLTQVARENLNRQQSRVRVFEIGRKFTRDDEIEVVAGLALGDAQPEQWDAPSRKIDFYDMKADVEAIIALSSDPGAFAFKADHHDALHPGQSAKVLRGSEVVGWIGALHPEVAKRLDLTYPVYVFELETKSVLRARLPEYAEISRFPAIRRDLAVIVDEAVRFEELAAAVRVSAGALLSDVLALSVYRGEQIDKGKKSMALGLNLQDTSRTLTDADADRVMTQVIDCLRTQFGASIRDK